MTLIKSISGIRGTIGGEPNNNLTPIDVVRFAAAYGSYILSDPNISEATIVIGRDARISGAMVQALVSNTLIGLGIDVIDLGMATTPTVEMMVPKENAQGGIILTASHNPKQWNALKLLDSKGEFLNAVAGAKILEIAKNDAFDFASVDDLGSIKEDQTSLEMHINAVLDHPLVEIDAIRSSGIKVVVDGVNSIGGIAIPALLKKLNIEVVELYCEPNGYFPHNPEPLKEHLGALSEKVKETKADFGIVVDPDVDRLAFIDENGEMFGEEYTLVACADYVLSKTPGNTVSNMSSTRALKDITEKHGGTYYSSAVGEVNVVTKMKEVNAIIGGEGNGGIIDPQLHYGRDSLIGTALFLSLLSEIKIPVSELKKTYPEYFMSKGKIELEPTMDVDFLLDAIEKVYQKENPNTIDGVKIDFSNSWVHLRKSNTEPIIRVYTEAPSQKEADDLMNRFKKELLELGS
ncbi:phosphoglucosamine mutase [Flavobacteriaceae bacterium]|uniref:phosphoglucosamine mutase n=1 Tax=Candidatus Arcticimaribacter forsetii TaxID=2820661 RepID=UPI002076FA2D|nr:phosphoglucosamine mutase [Candidatus Arcticimaribacter forsetii]MDB2325618.1 phosphoglucosamine mutase [Flavobacteriaceae bacterium]MDB2345766.1 phosphoglucosamine mutase [Flavobacteriaceae bacterium]MDB4674441.1 phosphoglucosamine mutase [Flavobacteriaceae bacterium]